MEIMILGNNLLYSCIGYINDRGDIYSTYIKLASWLAFGGPLQARGTAQSSIAVEQGPSKGRQGGQLRTQF